MFVRGLRASVSKRVPGAGKAVVRAAGGVGRFSVREASTSRATETLSDLSDDGIYTVTMNRPKTLNGWTKPMMLELKDHFEHAEREEHVKVMVLTGNGDYYCAGVNLAGVVKPMHPAKLHELIRQSNQALFDMFLDLKKPIIAAVNGPAIGASVTSATLCDAIVSSPRATFSTPFARLGVPPEGCSSVHFARFMGQENADRMMGEEAWVPTAKEARDALGFVHTVVEEEDGALLAAANELAREWIASGKPREVGPLKGDAHVAEEYKRVNAAESEELAHCFLGVDFLEGQRAFLSSKGKSQAAMVFNVLKLTRPVWSLLLPPKKSV